MDAPGFPDAAGGPYVTLVWLTLAVLVAASAVVTVLCLLRTRRTSVAVVGALLVVLGLLGALWLWTPASARIDPEHTEGAAECPFDSVQGARLLVDRSTRLYTFWQPCETASRVRIGVVLGGTAVFVVAGAAWQLRSRRRADLPREPTRSSS